MMVCTMCMGGGKALNLEGWISHIWFYYLLCQVSFVMFSIWRGERKGLFNFDIL